MHIADGGPEVLAGLLTGRGKPELNLTEAGLSYLEQLAEAGTAPDELIERLRRNLQARSRTLEDDTINPSRADGPAGTHAYLRLRRELLATQRDELTRLHHDGTISAATRRRMQRLLDLEEASLGDE